MAIAKMVSGGSDSNADVPGTPQLCTADESVRRALFRCLSILDGVADIHKRKVANRDLKLQNILENPSDPAGQILLTDFGISAHLAEEW